jgi:hypothetical protein
MAVPAATSEAPCEATPTASKRQDEVQPSRPAGEAAICALIFLDVDGVLHDAAPQCEGEKFCMMHHVSHPFEARPRFARCTFTWTPVCMRPPPTPPFWLPLIFLTDMNSPLAQLATIVRATGASVVLSSSWRQFPKAVLEIAAAMIAHGLAPPIGSTPSLLIGNRASEIGAWLLQNQRRLGPTLRWVAIDDTGLKGLGSHFVKTRKWGLSEVNFKLSQPEAISPIPQTRSGPIAK